jgi:hypothetical protein
MPYSLDPLKLHEGDVILTRNKKGPISWLIRLFTISYFSHAALYVGGNSYMEAIGCGVRAQNILRLTFRRKTDVVVLRYAGLQRDDLERIVGFVRYRHGMAYGVVDAIKAGLYAFSGKKLPLKMHANQTFCSQLVASAYSEVGVKKINGRSDLFVRPKDVYKEDNFKRVVDVYREITNEEVKIAAGEGIIDKQDRIVFSMMKKIWKVLKKEGVYIKGISEIDRGIYEIQNVQRRKSVDYKVGKIIRESGYLEMWKWDMEKSPENYSIAELQKKVLDSSELVMAATAKIVMWLGIMDLRQKNVLAAEANYAISQLETSKIFLDLENTLLFIAKKAFKEFESYLQNLKKKQNMVFNIS